MKKIVSLSLLLVVSNGFADSVGTVLFAAQKVIAQNGGAERALTRGASLSTGDTIITAANASAKIKYTNGTIVSIGAGSNYKIISYAPKQSDVAITAQLNKGKIESQTSGSEKREALKTPVVALAITGTKYKVYVKDRKKTNVELIEGKIQIGSQVLHPGDSIVATLNGISPAPFPAAGNIVMTPAMINAGDTSSSSSSSSTTTTSSGTGGGGAAASNASVQASGAETTTFVTTTTVVSQGVSSTTATNTGLEAVGQASFGIECFPSSQITS